MAQTRVLLVALAFGRQGGIETYNMNLASTLMSLGYEVDVWAVHDLDQSGRAGFRSVCLSPKGRLAKRVYWRIWKPYLRWYLTREHHRYELIVAGHLFVLPLVHQACQSSRSFVWACTFGTETWANWDSALYCALGSASAILTISRHTESVIRTRLPDSAIYRVPVVVDTDRFRPHGPGPSLSGPAVLLTVGRLSSQARYKGQDVVIRALPQIVQQVDHAVEYWIVGSGDDVPRLQRLAAEYGVVEHVKFLGRLSDEQLLKAYQSCDVFIMPSRMEQRPDGSWAGEGFGIAYLEAAACGKPVIASNQGGAAEAVRHGMTGFAVDPESVQAVADVTIALLTDPDLAWRMGQAGRQFVVKSFSMPVFRRRVAEVLRESGF